MLACPVSCLGSQLNYYLSVLKAPITSSLTQNYYCMLTTALCRKTPSKVVVYGGRWVRALNQLLPLDRQRRRGAATDSKTSHPARSLCPQLSADPRSHHTVCMTSANPPTIVGKQKALFNQAPNEVCRAPLTADNVLQPALQRSDIWTKHYRATVLLIIVTTKSSLVVNKQLLKVLWSRTSSF